MEHYQSRFVCKGCGRELIVDIVSIGTGHQMIQAVTCSECAKKMGGKIMSEDEVETIQTKRLSR